MDIYIILLLIIPPLLYLYLRKKPLDFPGPPTLPIIGNLHQFKIKSVHRDFTEWAEKYGPIFKLNMIGKEFLVINEIKIFHELMVTRGMEFAGRPTNHEVDAFSNFGKDIIFSQPTKEWKTMRKYGHTTMKMYDRGQDKIETVSMAIINDMIIDLKNKNGDPVAPEDYMYFVTTNIIAILLTGRTFSRDSQYYKLFLKFDEDFEQLALKRPMGIIMDTLPFLKGRYDLCGTEIDRVKKAMDALTTLARKETLKSEEEGCMDSLITNMKVAVEKEEITDGHMDQVITDMIIAGSLTTTTTMRGYINLLIHHPEIQKRIQEEVDDVIGERQVSLKDRGQMHYSMASLLEVLRYLSIVPVGVFHVPTKDTTIDGKFVPAKTEIFFNHYGVNHDPVNFPDPFTFKPERYLDDEGKLVAADHPNRRNANAFGWGPRVCLGEPLAKGRLFLLIVSLMQKFDIKPGPHGKVTCDVRDFDQAAVLRIPEYEACFISRS